MSTLTETTDLYGHPELPETLAKALVDPFDYALALRSGLWVRFERARLTREGWVELIKPQTLTGERLRGCCFERGLEVRIADVVACADAPQGS